MTKSVGRRTPRESDQPASSEVVNPPENRIFDKAEGAAEIEHLREEQRHLMEDIKMLETELAAAEERQKARVTRTLETQRGQLRRVEAKLARANRIQEQKE